MREAVERVVGRMVIDPQFRQAVKANAGNALSGFDLTPAEIESFSQLDHDEVQRSLSGLDTRVSKMAGPALPINPGMPG